MPPRVPLVFTGYLLYTSAYQVPSHSASTQGAAVQISQTTSWMPQQRSGIFKAECFRVTGHMNCHSTLSPTATWHRKSHRQDGTNVHGWALCTAWTLMFGLCIILVSYWLLNLPNFKKYLRNIQIILGLWCIQTHIGGQSGLRSLPSSYIRP